MLDLRLGVCLAAPFGDAPGVRLFAAGLLGCLRTRGLVRIGGEVRGGLGGFGFGCGCGCGFGFW